MGGYPHELLNLSTPNGIVRENSNNNKRTHEAASHDKRLELKLGPPGETQPLHHISPKSHNNSNTYITALGSKREFLHTIVEAETKERNWLTNSEEPQSGLEKKAHATPAAISPLTIGVPNSSKKRIDLRPVVGWPPVHSCRKNILTSNSTKLEPESSNKVGKEVAGGKSEILENSLFVKIKMDGVPIGRKVDLKSYSSYDKLSSAVDELFRGLLAAQGDCSHSLDESMEKTKAITGLLDGSGDYNLVYEDNEGDRMLVGDVPWHMFISSAKQLRVLKKSKLSGLHVISNKLAEAPDQD